MPILAAGLAEIFGVPQRYIDAITFKQPLRIGKYNEKAGAPKTCKAGRDQEGFGQVSCVNTMAAGLRYSDRAGTPTGMRDDESTVVTDAAT